MSATSELIGTEAACPSCNEPFIVPPPLDPADSATSTEPEVPELAELVQRVRSLGYDFALPPSITAEVVQWHLSALDEFLSEQASLREAIDEMERTKQITAAPTDEELHAVGDLLLAQILAGEWGGTTDELRALLWEVAPDIRGSE
jgi:hypothetical protein